MRKQKELDFRQFAILVRDRHQALRLAEFFDQLKIPYLNQRGTSLVDSPALPALIDLLRSVLRPQDRGTMRTALGGAILGWTYEELKSLESMEHVVLLVQRLKRCLLEKGFAAFFQQMLQTAFRSNGQTILEEMLQ